MHASSTFKVWKPTFRAWASNPLVRNVSSSIVGAAQTVAERARAKMNVVVEESMSMFVNLKDSSRK